MKENPKVSVCIPVYNRPDYVAEAIESIINATNLQRFWFVIVL